MKSNRAFDKIQVTVHAALHLSLWRQSAVQRGLFVKPELEHWQTMQTKADAAERGVWSESALFA